MTKKKAAAAEPEKDEGIPIDEIKTIDGFFESEEARDANTKAEAKSLVDEVFSTPPVIKKKYVLQITTGYVQVWNENNTALLERKDMKQISEEEAQYYLERQLKGWKKPKK